MQPYGFTPSVQHRDINKTSERVAARVDLARGGEVDCGCGDRSCYACDIDTDGDWWWLDCQTHCDACLLECISGIVAPEPLATLADVMVADRLRSLRGTPRVTLPP